MRSHALRPAFARHALAADHDQPIAGINTTPLIDVMLVLLVMFIMIIPIQMNEIPMNLPQAGPVAPSRQVPHELAIARDGAVTLDGAALSGMALSQRLEALARDRRAELRIRTDASARYEVFAQTLAVVKRAGITRLGFVSDPADRRPF